MVKAEQVADGIVSFADAEILPAMEGWQFWTASAAIVLARQRADLIISTLAGNKFVSALGIIDADGMVDVDAAIEAAKHTAQKHGKLEIDLPMIGKIKLSGEDFDTLREHIMKSKS